MCHVCGFICYLCIELKLMINTRSLSNQALKSAHPSLLSSRCWPWGLFIGAGQPLQHGEVRDTNLAWLRPVIGAASQIAKTLGSTSIRYRSGEPQHVILLFMVNVVALRFYVLSYQCILLCAQTIHIAGRHVGGFRGGRIGNFSKCDFFYFNIV